MDTKYNGGPAFPGVLTNTDDFNKIGLEGETIPPGHQAEYSGMTLRDYFAAKVLHSVIAYSHGDVDTSDGSHFAAQAYRLADAMLAARGAA